MFIVGWYCTVVLFLFIVLALLMIVLLLGLGYFGMLGLLDDCFDDGFGYCLLFVAWLVDFGLLNVGCLC